MTAITNHWNDPFWADFSKIPFNREFAHSDDDSLVFVCREGFDIGIDLDEKGCVYLELEEALYLNRCLGKAIDDAKAARSEASRYFRETASEELKKKKESLPDTIEALQKDAAAIAADLAALQAEAASGKDMAGAASDLTDKAETLQMKLNELRRTIRLIRDKKE